MAITFIAATDDGGTKTFNVPAGTADGDVMFLVLSTENSALGALAPPAGWGTFNTNRTSTGISGESFWRHASNEPASYTYTGGSGTNSAVCATFRGINLQDAGNSFTSNSTTDPAASLSDANAGELIIYTIAAKTTGGGGPTIGAGTSGFSLAHTYTSGSKLSTIFYKVQAASGTTGSLDPVLNSASYAVWWVMNLIPGAQVTSVETNLPTLATSGKVPTIVTDFFQTESNTPAITTSAKVPTLTSGTGSLFSCGDTATITSATFAASYLTDQIIHPTNAAAITTAGLEVGDGARLTVTNTAAITTTFYPPNIISVGLLQYAWTNATLPYTPTRQEPQGLTLSPTTGFPTGLDSTPFEIILSRTNHLEVIEFNNDTNDSYTNSFVFKLNGIQQPKSGTSVFSFGYNLYGGQGSFPEVKFTLMEGSDRTKKIWTWNFSNYSHDSGATDVNANFVLPQTIGDYSNLYLLIEYISGFSPQWDPIFRLAYIQFQFPDIAPQQDDFEFQTNNPRLAFTGFDAIAGPATVVSPNTAATSLLGKTPNVVPDPVILPLNIIPVPYLPNLQPQNEGGDANWPPALSFPTTAPWYGDEWFRPHLANGGWYALDPRNGQYIYAWYNGFPLGVDTFETCVQMAPFDSRIPGTYSISVTLAANALPTFDVKIYLLNNDNSVVGFINPTVTGIASTQTFIISDVSKITSPQEMYCFILGRANLGVVQEPTKTFIYALYLTVPNPFGVSFITVDNTAGILTAGLAPTISAVSPIPDPGLATMLGKDASIVPDAPLQNLFVATDTSPFYQVIDLSTKALQSGWPPLASKTNVVASNGTVVVAGSQGAPRVSVITAATKQFVIGVPTFPTEVKALAISPDGNKVAVGSRQYISNTDNAPLSATTTGFNVLNLTLNAIEANWPAINSLVWDISWGPNNFIAVACAVWPYLVIINANTVTIDSSWPQVEGSAYGVEWINGNLYVIHAGGKCLTVISGTDKTVQTGWPTITDPVPRAIAGSPSNIAIVSGGIPGVINISSKQLVSLPPVTGEVVSLGWASPSVMAVGQSGIEDNSTGVSYIDISTRTIITSPWPTVPGKVQGLENSGTIATIPPPVFNVVITPDPKAVTITGLAPTVNILQQIFPSTGVITTTKLDPVVTAPSTTVLIPVLSTYKIKPNDAVVTPINDIESPNSFAVVTKTFSPTITAISPIFKMISSSDTAFTAAEAVEINTLNLGTAMYGAARQAAFRLANVFNIPYQFTLATKGSNTILNQGVSYSSDRVNWVSSLSDVVGNNAISEIIYVRVIVPQDSPTGESTFLIDITATEVS